MFDIKYIETLKKWEEFEEPFNHTTVIDLSKQPCMIEQFFQNNPRERMALISCNCPRCRVWC